MKARLDWAAAALIVYVVARKLIFGDPTQGWASLVCIILAVGGFELFTTGIVGQYIAKIYTKDKEATFIHRARGKIRRM